mmetsp:Transcript_56574/g.112506  ORF Transcript_56574/g.112506 Transcript_56574/m.112506 type:complete len:339 (+) Transcript_56574:32-1048(+)
MVAMTGRMGPVRLVIGKLMLAAGSLAVIVVLLGVGAGRTSAGAGVDAGTVPRALLDVNELDFVTQDELDGAIADGFDRNEDGAMFAPRKEDKDHSAHGFYGTHVAIANKTHGLYRKHMRKHAASYALLFVVQTAIVFGFAWILRQYGLACLPQESEPDQDPESGRAVFAYGLFDEKECWSEDLVLCILSFCCTGIQWASTVSKPKIGIFSSFWLALTLSALNSYELNALTHGVSSMVWIVIAVYARQSLREKYGLESRSMITLAQDIFVWCCWCRCAVAQEARQVERVRLLDTNNNQFGEASQLQVEEELPSSRRNLLRPNEDGVGRENTANTDVSGL